ncbi:MAG: hypothetical protein M3394_03370 [Actinomycetota bacterium]|nr:hypothetical protein [Actinomycetota bacterium]
MNHHGLTGVVMAVLAVTAACGSDSDEAAPTSTSSSSTVVQTTASSTTSSTAPPAKVTTLDFEYTDRQGWHYKASFPFRPPAYRFQKTIDSSPPGIANLYFTSGLPTEDVILATIVPDNPGRPNGPRLSIRHPALVLEMPAAAGPKGRDELDLRWGCLWRNQDDTPFARAVSCNMNKADARQACWDCPEEHVDALVRVVPSIKPTWEFDLFVSSCPLFLLPDGGNYTDEQCGSDGVPKITRRDS